MAQSRRAGGGTPATALAADFLAQIEPVLPGLTARWNGRAAFENWPAVESGERAAREVLAALGVIPHA